MKNSIITSLTTLLTTTLCFFLSLTGIAQVTTNSGSGLAATYPSLANAITALNTASITSPIVITLSGDETAPVGGYSITAQGSSANTILIEGISSTITSSNTLVIGALNDGIFKIIGGDFITIQNFTLQENALNIVNTPATNTMTEWGIALLHASITNGAQNNTIQNCSISLDKTYSNTFGIYANNRHSATNVTTTQAVTNNTTGPNNNNKIYGNTISNVNMGIAFIGTGTAANQDNGNDIGGTSASTGNTITNWGGQIAATAYNSNSGSTYGIFVNHQVAENVSFNTITSSTLAGTSVTIRGILKDYSANAPSGTFTSTISNNMITITDNFTSGALECIRSQGMTTLATATISINSNTILNTAVGGVSSSTTIVGIVNTSAPGILNVLNNIFQGNTSTATTGGFTGISNSGAVVNQININNNQLGNNLGGAITFNNATSGAFLGISNSAGTAATCLLSIQSNDLRGINYNTLSTSTNTYISNTGSTFSQNISNNTFTNLQINSSGSVTFITNGGNANSAGSKTINNNSIVTAFIKSATGGNISLYADAGNTSATHQNNNNNFSNITVSGNTTISGWNNTNGSTTNPLKTFDGNIFSNWTCGTGTISIIQPNFGGNTITNNSISNISSQGTINCINIGTGSSIQNCTINNNTISGISSSGANANVFGILSASQAASTLINTNNINTLSSTDANADVYGISSSGTNSTIFGNTVTGLTIAGSGNGTTNGIRISGGGSTQIYENKVYNLSNTSAFTTQPGVNGILLSGGTNVTVSNNFIGELNASIASSTDAIRGISITSTAVNSNYKVYYNTIHLSGSGGTNFGTSGLFHAASTVSTTANLDLRNNIITNLCTPSGTGRTVAYRRSSGTSGMLENYSNLSNNNLFYSGTPSATRLIYSDGTSTAQTLAAYNLGVFTAGNIAPRDNASISENPNYLSTVGSNSNFLHIGPSINTQIESAGMALPGITNDYDGDTRNISTPDLGADEFSGTVLQVAKINSLTNSNPATLCSATLRTITANVTAGSTDLVSVTLNYAFNGVVQTPVIMTGGTLTAGSTSDFTGNIPAATPSNATVSYSVTVIDANVSKNLVGTNYFDNPSIGLTATSTANPTSVCLGNTTELTQTIVKSGSTTLGNTLGTAITTTGTPYRTNAAINNEIKNQYLIRASELIAAGYTAGKFTSLGINVTTAAPTGTMNNFSIGLANVSANYITATFLTNPLTTVYNVAAYSPTNGLNTHVFSSPFIWDGTSNVLINICSTVGVTGSGTTLTTSTTPVGFGATTGSNSATGCSDLTGTQISNRRPRFNIGFEPTVSSHDWTLSGSSVGTTNPLTINPIANGTYTSTAIVNGCPIVSNVNVSVILAAPTNVVGTYTSGVIDHTDGSTQVYNYDNCITIGEITDAAGGNVLGNTTMTTTVTASILTTNPEGYIYARRGYSVSPASDGAMTLKMYFTQEDFDNYNSNAANFLSLPTSGDNSDPNIPFFRIATVLGGTHTISGPLGATGLTWNGTHWEFTMNVTTVAGAQYYVATMPSCSGIAVSNLAATNVTTDAVTATWTSVVTTPTWGWYSLQYRVVGAPAWTDAGTANNPATSAFRNGLVPGTNYEMQIRRHCSGQSTGPWSASVFFTTLGGGCSSPMVLNTPTVTTTTATTTWTAISGAAWYEFQYKEASSGTWISAGTLAGTATSKLFAGLTAGTAYNFRGRTYCSSGTPSPWSVIANATTSNTASGCSLPPVLAATAVNASNITLSWTAVSGAAWYEFRYSSVSTTGPWTSGGTLGGASTSKSFTGLSQNTTYYFEARTYCSNGIPSAWGALQATTTTPTGCQLPPALTATTVLATTATMTWPAVAGASWYEFRYKPTASGTWLTAGTLAGTGTTKTLTGLTAGTQYDFQARTFCSNGLANAWSTTLQFTTAMAMPLQPKPGSDLANDKALENTNIDVNVYPNPTSDLVNIETIFEEVDAAILVKVIDMNGRIVLEMNTLSVEGKNAIQLSLENLNVGIYNLEIYNNNSLIDRSKVIKVN